MACFANIIESKGFIPLIFSTCYKFPINEIIPSTYSTTNKIIKKRIDLEE